LPAAGFAAFAFSPAAIFYPAAIRPKIPSGCFLSGGDSLEISVRLFLSGGDSPEIPVRLFLSGGRLP